MPAGARDFAFSEGSRPDLRLSQPGSLSLGLKRPGRKWSHNLSPSARLHGVCNDYFAFTWRFEERNTSVCRRVSVPSVVRYPALNFCLSCMLCDWLDRRFPNYAAAPRGATGYFKILLFAFNLSVLFFKKATKLLGQTDIKLLRPNCFMKRSVRYFFWPRGSVKKLLRY